jgi:hypothetical protein
VVKLRYFGGLSVEEAAAVLKVSVETVTRDWRLARGWLLSEIEKTVDCGVTVTQGRVAPGGAIEGRRRVRGVRIIGGNEEIGADHAHGSCRGGVGGVRTATARPVRIGEL